MGTQVTVTVDDTDPNNPVVSTSPEPLDIGQSNGSVNITWVVGTDGWEVSDVANLPSPEFSEKAKNNNGYKVKDKNDDTNSYSYNLAVTHITSGRLVRHDPTIKNGGRG